MKKKWMAVGLVLILALSMFAAGCSSQEGGGGEKTVSLQYAHPVSEDSNTHRLGLKFKEEVQRLSDGTITIQLLSNFGSERELLESMQRGDVAFTLTSAAPVVNFEPRMSVFDVPFLFQSKETPQETMKSVFQAFDTPEVKETLTYLEESNIRGLGYLGLGFRVLATDKEIKTRDDLKGIKLRTMENKNHIAAWKALGANPTPMAFNEVYTALEQGTIDGQEQPFDILDSNHFYEVQDYATTIDMIYNTTLFMMSKSVYDGLAPEQQEMIDEAAQLAIEYARKDAIESVAANAKSLEDHGMTVNSLTEADKERAKELVKPVEDSIRAEIGDEIVDVFHNAVESAK